MRQQLYIVSRPAPILSIIVRAFRRRVVMLLAFSVIIFLAYTQALADPIGPASAKTAGPSSEARQEQLTREYLIKAAILYNVAKFASWPDSAFNSADEPVHLCVLGRNPFGAALETLRGKRVGSRKLAVSAIAEVEYAAACHVLFVSASEQQRVAEILAAVSSHPILTVADFDRFATEGGIVGLTEVDDRARLQVNVDAAGQAGVRLSSKLLRLADTVETQTAQMNAAPEQ